MQFVTGFQLIRTSNSELSALFHRFNQAVARTEPYTSEWSDALFSVNNILRERIRRADAPAPGGPS